MATQGKNSNARKTADLLSPSLSSLLALLLSEQVGKPVDYPVLNGSGISAQHATLDKAALSGSGFLLPVCLEKDANSSFLQNSDTGGAI